jgi:hypothetical protein
MSERDRNDESNEPEFEMGVVAGEETRNRPAMGATFAESTQELDLDWKGSSAATDFLGIDADVRGDGLPGPAGPGLGTQTLPADSWLHGIEARTEELAPAALKRKKQPISRRTKKRSTRRARSTRSRSRARWFESSSRPWSCSRSPGAAPGTGRRSFSLGNSRSKWRRNPRSRPVKKPAPPTKTTPVTKHPVADTPTKTPSDTNTDPTAVTSDTPSNPIETQPLDPIPVVAVTPPVATTDTPITAPVPVTATNLEPAGPTTNLRVPPPSDAPIPGAVRRATDADYANLWREQSVPLEAIPGDRRLRTINVGQVRVMLDSGEYFEGLLYAVGQNRVWLDLDLGRIAFEAASVRDITRIPMPASTTVGGKKGPDLSQTAARRSASARRLASRPPGRPRGVHHHARHRRRHPHGDRIRRSPPDHGAEDPRARNRRKARRLHRQARGRAQEALIGGPFRASSEFSRLGVRLAGPVVHPGPLIFHCFGSASRDPGR